MLMQLRLKIIHCAWNPKILRVSKFCEESSASQERVEFTNLDHTTCT
jgi:hypothetical protein